MIKRRIKDILIVCLVCIIVVEALMLLTNKKEPPLNFLEFENLNSRETVEKYLMAHKTGEKELLILRLLDEFYDKSSEYLNEHSDIANVKSVEVIKIDEVKLTNAEKESIISMSEQRGFSTASHIEDIRSYKVKYNLIPINEDKGFLMGDYGRREESIILLKRFGLWKVFDQGAV